MDDITQVLKIFDIDENVQMGGIISTIYESLYIKKILRYHHLKKPRTSI